MKLDKFNNLLELFLFQYKKKELNEIFLQSLKHNNRSFSWKETYDCIQKLTSKLSKYIILQH